MPGAGGDTGDDEFEGGAGGGGGADVGRDTLDPVYLLDVLLDRGEYCRACCTCGC